jgi:DNA-3-methyladenine glycosylase I
MPEAPLRIEPRNAAGYFEQMAKAIFQSGISRKVVESKWPGIRDAFRAFDPIAVASFTEEDIAALAADTRVIRNRRKLAALVENARKLVELDECDGGFRAYLRGHGGFEPTVAALRRDFAFMGDFGSYWFLYVVGEDVPEHEAWMASRGKVTES